MSVEFLLLVKLYEVSSFAMTSMGWELPESWLRRFMICGFHRSCVRPDHVFGGSAFLCSERESPSEEWQAKEVVFAIRVVETGDCHRQG